MIYALFFGLQFALCGYGFFVYGFRKHDARNLRKESVIIMIGMVFGSVASILRHDMWGLGLAVTAVCLFAASFIRSTRRIRESQDRKTA